MKVNELIRESLIFLYIFLGKLISYINYLY
jgi:hypothetical protein